MFTNKDVNGWLIVSAFTITYDWKYIPLLDATKECTYEGIKTVIHRNMSILYISVIIKKLFSQMIIIINLN